MGTFSSQGFRETHRLVRWYQGTTRFVELVLSTDPRDKAPDTLTKSRRPLRLRWDIRLCVRSRNLNARSVTGRLRDFLGKSSKVIPCAKHVCDKEPHTFAFTLPAHTHKDSS
ncbi:hypothetical protein ISCGN_026377 [Ixodes scapularis]